VGCYELISAWKEQGFGLSEKSSEGKSLGFMKHLLSLCFSFHYSLVEAS